MKVSIDSKSPKTKGVEVAVGVTHVEPITAMRAVLKIEDVEVVDSKFTDQKGRAQRQFACTLKVLSGAGERDGETLLNGSRSRPAERSARR